MKYTPDAYEICRHVKRYHEKNAYAPKRSELGAPDDFVDLLVKNGVIEILPITPNGPPVAVVLTDKGQRMAEANQRKRA